MVDIWISSDWHLSHKKILTFVSPDGTFMRPFASIEEHDETLISRHNEMVKPKDHVYHLGDVTMARQPSPSILALLRRFQGHKRLVLGNHDQWEVREYVRAGFEKVMAYRVLAEVVMSHIPLHPDSINRRVLGNAHGHCHTNRSPEGRYVNVCPELHAYRPLHLDEVREMLKGKGEEG